MGRHDDERIVAASDLRAAQMARANAGAQPYVDPWHRGDWMQTFTGRRFYPLTPRPEDIDPIDIAHALSMLCRYNGHIDRFYSVAEHCVLMSSYLWAWAVDQGWDWDRVRGVALEALLHDASESYVGDMVRPLKHANELIAYRQAEDRVSAAVWMRFGLPTHAGDHPVPRRALESSLVKDADTRILLTERTALMPNYKPSDRWSMDGMEALPVDIHAWEPVVAEYKYLERLRALGAIE
jgi:5'-deoxynucleotidase YfbR-like HD superfamily hydrolase